MTSTVAPSQLSSSSAIANLLLDNNKPEVETHPDWEEKRPVSPPPAIADATSTSSSTTSRTRNPSSVSFSLSSPSTTSSSATSSSGRTERHRRRRAQRGSPVSSPVFTPAELEAQKAKRTSWLQQKETSLQQQRDSARKEKEVQGNRWLVGVLLLWLVVIVVIMACVGRSLWEGQSRQQARVRSAEMWRQSVGPAGRSERLTSMIDRDW